MPFQSSKPDTAVRASVSKWEVSLRSMDPGCRENVACELASRRLLGALVLTQEIWGARCPLRVGTKRTPPSPIPGPRGMETSKAPEAGSTSRPVERSRGGRRSTVMSSKCDAKVWARSKAAKASMGKERNKRLDMRGTRWREGSIPSLPLGAACGLCRWAGHRGIPAGSAGRLGFRPGQGKGRVPPALSAYHFFAATFTGAGFTLSLRSRRASWPWRA